MKNNKLICIVLALLVCLTMAVSASATTTESDLTFAVESKDSTVEILNAAVVNAGETFTVNVNIVDNAGFKAAIAYVQFDAEKLEFIEAKNVADGVKILNNQEGKVQINVGTFNMGIISNPTGYETITTTGTVVELTFKTLAKTDMATAVNVNVNRSNVIDANGKFQAVVSGGSLNVNVVAADHVCDANKTVEANNKIEPTCTTAGKEADKVCAHCGKVVTEGAEIKALGHAWNDGEITKAPTCTEAGVKTFTCTVCGDSSKTEEVPAAGEHTWDEGKITTEPTCADFGVRTYTCTACGETKVDDHVAATGEHKYGDWTVTREATVDAEGEETRTCSVCGDKETRSIEKLPEPESNTVLIVVIIVVVVLAGAGVAAYFVLKNKKK